MLKEELQRMWKVKMYFICFVKDNVQKGIYESNETTHVLGGINREIITYHYFRAHLLSP